MKEAKASPVMAGAWAWGAGFAGGDQVFGAALGELLKGIPRESVVISTKFTPQIAASVGKPVEAMLEESLKRLGTDYIDLYWIHNSADVE